MAAQDGTGSKTGNAKIQGVIPGLGDGKYQFRNALNRANQDAVIITQQFAQHYAECCGCLKCCKPCCEYDLCIGDNMLSKWGDSPHTWVMENRVEWQRSWPSQCCIPLSWDSTTEQPQPCTCKIGCCFAIRCHGCIDLTDSVTAAPFDQFASAHPLCRGCSCFRDICGCSGTVGLMRPCLFPLCCCSRPAYVIRDVHDPAALAEAINVQKTAHKDRNGGWDNTYGASFFKRTLVCDCCPSMIDDN